MTGGPVRIVTYNLQGGGRPSQWAWLAAGSFDLAFVQEANDPRNGDPTRWRWRRRRPAAWGTGIWARTGALTEPLEVLGLGGEVLAVFIDGVPDLPLQATRLLAVNIHNPTYHPKAPATVEEILNALPRFEGVPVIIAGDFNMASVGERGPGETLATTQAERQLLARLRDEWGLVPCWPAVHRRAPLAQTLRWHKDRTIPYHCDSILVPVPWANTLVACEIENKPELPLYVDKAFLSDHHPVVATLG